MFYSSLGLNARGFSALPSPPIDLAELRWSGSRSQLCPPELTSLTGVDPAALVASVEAGGDEAERGRSRIAAPKPPQSSSCMHFFDDRPRRWSLW